MFDYNIHNINVIDTLHSAIYRQKKTNLSEMPRDLRIDWKSSTLFFKYLAYISE